MTGPINSIIGSDIRTVTERFRTKIGSRLTVADGEVMACGALFEVDINSKKAVSVKRICF